MFTFYKLYFHFSCWNFKFFSISDLSYGTNQYFMPFTQAQFFVARYPQNYTVLGLFKVLDHFWDLLNEVLYEVLSLGASEIPQVIHSGLQFYWIMKNFLLRLLVALMLLQVEHHTVPLFKGLTSVLKQSSGHGHNRTFIMHHSILKSTQFAS